MEISQVQNRPYNLKYSFSLSILFSKKINVMSQYPHLYGSPTLHIHNLQYFLHVSKSDSKVSVLK